MEEENKKEFSFADVMRTVWSRKFLALIIAVAITLAGTLALFFGYNAATNYYESAFTINFPVSAGGLIQYPDGRQRNFRDLISEDNLKAVKNSNKALAEIDVPGMLKKGGISIEQQGKDNASYFTLKVETHYFSSEDVAEIFVDAIVNSIKLDLLNSAKSNEKSVRSGFEKSLGNERKVNFLSKQLEYFTARFASIGNMPTDALTEINNITHTLNALKGSLHTHYYESDVEALKSYVNERIELNRQLENAEKVLKNLMEAGADTTDGNGSLIIIDGTQIVEYTEKVNSLMKELEDIDKYLEPYKTQENEYNIPQDITDKSNEEFDKALLTVLEDICGLSTVYEAEHWNNYSAASYTGLRLNLVYGFKLVYCILVSVVVGIVVAAIVAYAVAKKSENKNLDSQTTQTAEEGKEAAEQS